MAEPPPGFGTRRAFLFPSISTIARKSLTHTLGKESIVAKKKKVSNEFGLVDENIDANGFAEPSGNQPVSSSPRRAEDVEAEEQPRADESGFTSNGIPCTRGNIDFRRTA